MMSPFHILLHPFPTWWQMMTADYWLLNSFLFFLLSLPFHSQRQDPSTWNVMTFEPVHKELESFAKYCKDTICIYVNPLYLFVSSCTKVYLVLCMWIHKFVLLPLSSVCMKTFASYFRGIYCKYVQNLYKYKYPIKSSLFIIIAIYFSKYLYRLC